jgi:uncharacterized protein
MQHIIAVRFRFFGDLHIFLSPERRVRPFTYHIRGRPALKNPIEALGVPHTEAARVLVNDKPSTFSYQLADGDRVRVYPFTAKDPVPRGPFRFVVDSHLGKLVRHLRLMGFDAVFKKIFPDEEMIRTSVRENRIILTRDTALLKNKVVRRGYWVRSVESKTQLKEVFRRYRLWAKAKPFSRCLACNGKIRRAAKTSVEKNLPPKVRLFYKEFFRCQSCGKVYWKGSHFESLRKLLTVTRHMTQGSNTEKNFS